MMTIEQASNEANALNAQAGWDKHFIFPLANGLWAVATSMFKAKAAPPEQRVQVSIWGQRDGRIERTWQYGGE